MKKNRLLQFAWIRPWRIVLWGSVIALLLLPLLAMQFTDEVHWTGFDFAAATVLLGGTALLLELAFRKKNTVARRVGWSIAALSSLLLIWINLAVGIIGNENNPTNLLYFIIIIILILGLLLTRYNLFSAHHVLCFTAALQVGIEVIIQYNDLGAAPFLTAAFTLCWLLAAGLLRQAISVPSSVTN